jgi:hypothetical protein
LNLLLFMLEANDTESRTHARNLGNEQLGHKT